MLRALDALAPHVVFLDVQMPEIDGFEVIRRRADRCREVIFLTAYDEFAIRAFEAEALDYLVKPVSEERFAATIERLTRRLRKAEHRSPSRRRAESVSFPSPRSTGSRPPTITRSLWVGERSYLVRRSLSELERGVAAHGFARAHRQALVRIAAVRALEETMASSSLCSSPVQPFACRGADAPRLPPPCGQSRDSRARNTRRETVHPNADTTRVLSLPRKTEAMHRSRGPRRRRRIVMRRIMSFCCAFLVIASSPLAAQAPASKTPEQLQAAYAEHRADFDYLLGDWEFTAVSKEMAEFRGLWSAVSLADGQILDEFRVVGDAGETFYLTTTIRSYNALLDRWELIGMERGNGLQDFGTAQRDGNEMHIEQRFGVTSAAPTVRRIRYYGIGADRFSWTSDLSRDNGSTWVSDELRIEARRIGAPRSLDPLAAPRE